MVLLGSRRRVGAPVLRDYRRDERRVVADSSDETAEVIGRWAGTRRIQVRLEDGSYEVVESSGSEADDVDPGDKVIISFDSEGRPADWRRADGP